MRVRKEGRVRKFDIALKTKKQEKGGSRGDREAEAKTVIRHEKRRGERREKGMETERRRKERRYFKTTLTTNLT